MFNQIKMLCSCKKPILCFICYSKNKDGIKSTSCCTLCNKPSPNAKRLLSCRKKH